MSENRSDDKQLNFLIEDYWEKVQYLKDHFTRMWNRFNYFLAIHSALFGATALSPDKYRWWVPVFAALVCCLWYVFGAQDRYLVLLYRKEIEKTVEEIKQRLGLTTTYYYVGDTTKATLEALKIEQGFCEWRIEGLSTTRLPALFPVILLVIWVSVLVLLFAKS